MANLRKIPFIYITWFKNYLVGDDLCRWSIWHRIYYEYEQAKSNFDSVKYDVEHTAFLNEIKQRYIAQGYEVYPEMKITVFGSIAKMIGKIDLIAIKDGRQLIIEVKTGVPRKSDRIQTMLYIWALPRALTRFRGMSFDGLIIYKSHEIEVSALDLDEQFLNNFRQFTKDVLSGEPDRKHPTPRECAWCKIANCDERAESEIEEQSDYVADFF